MKDAAMVDPDFAEPSASPRKIAFVRAQQGANSTPSLADLPGAVFALALNDLPPRDAALPPRDGTLNETELLEQLSAFDGVIFNDFSLGDVEKLFRLRALQVLAQAAALPKPSVVRIAASDQSRLIPGLRRRIASSWPFASVLFVADGAAARALAAEGLPTVSASEAGRLGPEGLLAHPQAAACSAAADQGVGVQIQPMWGRCGSSTAFANELDTLLDAGHFVVRVYIDHERRFGPSAVRQFPPLVAENTIDAGPHLEALSAFPGAPASSPLDELTGFIQSVKIRARSEIVDPVAQRLACIAQVAIVNHAVNVAFAGRACPQARIVLDTHDYLTRNAVERARGAANAKAFPTCDSLRRHVALERRLWTAADVCTTVSHEEEVRVRRNNPKCLMVFPEPYVRPWSDPGARAEWDLLLVADKHFFNINSVAWFLEEVVSKSERLTKMRIGVVGQVRQMLEHLWAERLPNVKWLGFVHDLDETRALSRVAVCPDRGGTGISVKALSALAAGQPMVATSVAYRGLPASVVADVVVCDDAKTMALDIIALIDDPAKLRDRSENARRTYAKLKYAGSYATAMELARGRAGVAAREALIADFAHNEVADMTRPEIQAGVLRLGFENRGAAAPLLGLGWHNGERWGRWTDGDYALFAFPRAWLDGAIEIEFRFLDAKRPAKVALFCDHRLLTPANLSTRHRAAYIKVDEELKSGGEMITFAFHATRDADTSDKSGRSEDRVLGLGMRSVSLSFTQAARMKLRLKQAVLGPFGRKR